MSKKRKKPLHPPKRVRNPSDSNVAKNSVSKPSVSKEPTPKGNSTKVMKMSNQVVHDPKNNINVNKTKKKPKNSSVKDDTKIDDDDNHKKETNPKKKILSKTSNFSTPKPSSNSKPSLPSLPTKASLKKNKRNQKPLPSRNLKKCFDFSVESSSKDASSLTDNPELLKIEAREKLNNNKMEFDKSESEEMDVNKEKVSEIKKIKDIEEQEEDHKKDGSMKIEVNHHDLLIDPNLEGFSSETERTNLTIVAAITSSESDDSSSSSDSDEETVKDTDEEDEDTIEKEKCVDKKEFSTPGNITIDEDDSDIEIIGVVTVSNDNTGQFIKTEVKEEKVDNESRPWITEIKEEGDNKFTIQQAIISSQSCKINRMEKKLHALMEHIKTKDVEDDNLLAMSKIIDSKNPNTTIMPEMITIDDEDTPDEVLSSPNLSSPDPELFFPSDASPPAESPSLPADKIVLHKTADTFS